MAIVLSSSADFPADRQGPVDHFLSLREIQVTYGLKRSLLKRLESAGLHRYKFGFARQAAVLYRKSEVLQVLHQFRERG